MNRAKNKPWRDIGEAAMPYHQPRQKNAPTGFLAKSSREDRRQKRGWKRGRK